MGTDLCPTHSNGADIDSLLHYTSPAAFDSPRIPRDVCSVSIAFLVYINKRILVAVSKKHINSKHVSAQNKKINVEKSYNITPNISKVGGFKYFERKIIAVEECDKNISNNL